MECRYLCQVSFLASLSHTVELLRPNQHNKLHAALTAQQHAEIEECFEMLDRDGSGAIDVQEIIHAFGALGFAISQEAIEELMLEADPDGSGELEFDEVSHALSVHEPIQGCPVVSTMCDPFAPEHAKLHTTRAART